MRYCNQCHAANNDESNFCVQCGAHLADSTPALVRTPAPAVPLPPVPAPMPSVPKASSISKARVSSDIGHVREDTPEEIRAKWRTRKAIACILIPLLVIGASLIFTMRRISARANDYLHAIANNDYATALSIAGDGDLHAAGMVPLNTLGDYMPRGENRIAISAIPGWGGNADIPSWRSVDVHYDPWGEKRTLTIDASPLAYASNLFNGQWRFNGMSEVFSVATSMHSNSIVINGNTLDLTSLGDGCTVKTLDYDEISLASTSIFSLARFNGDFALDSQYRVCTFLTWPGTYEVSLNDEDKALDMSGVTSYHMQTIAKQDWDAGQHGEGITLVIPYTA